MKHAIRPVRLQVYGVVLVCNAALWEELRGQFAGLRPGITQGREYYSRTFTNRRVVVLRAGEGTIAAASAAQFAIDHWNPKILMMTSSADGEAEAVREVGEINGTSLLPEVLEGELPDSIPAAFSPADEFLRIQKRTR